MKKHIAYVCADAGIPVFGPSRAAAMLEASKAFTKEICDACGAPTAAWAAWGLVALESSTKSIPFGEATTSQR